MKKLTGTAILAALFTRWIVRRNAPYWTAAIPVEAYGVYRTKFSTFHRGMRHEANFTYLYCNN